MKTKICNLIITMYLFNKFFKGKKMKVNEEDMTWHRNTNAS